MKFIFKAINAAGAVVSGSLEAESEPHAIQSVRGLGYLPIHAIEEKAARWKSLLPQGVWRPRAPSNRQIAVATQELSALLQAGLTLDRALTILADLEEAMPLRKPLRQIVSAVRDGSSLGDAFALSGLFPRYYVSIVRAGEASGELEPTMARLGDYMARAAAIRDTIVSALIYPAILVATALLSIAVILVFVLPQFQPLFAQAGKQLPLVSRVLMAFGDFVAGYWWAIIGALGILTLLFGRAMRDTTTRLRWDTAVLRVPIFGDLVMKMQVERLARMMETLLRNGVALPQALLLAQDTLSNSAVAKAIGDTALRLKEGEDLAARLRHTGLFPATALDLVRIGGETGRLAEMMTRLADLYEREVRHAIDRLLSLLVPCLTVLMGVIVAGLIASILTAILSVNELAL